MNPTELLFPERVGDGGRGGDVSFSRAAASLGALGL